MARPTHPSNLELQTLTDFQYGRLNAVTRASGDIHHMIMLHDQGISNLNFGGRLN